MQKMSAKEMKTISDLNNKNIKCSYELCKIKIKEKNILALLQRSKIEDVCREDYDILINLSKYRLPKCTDYSKKIINNTDLKKYGSQYLYFWFKELATSSILKEKPHSLSYQAPILTIFPAITLVWVVSKFEL